MNIVGTVLATTALGAGIGAAAMFGIDGFVAPEITENALEGIVNAHDANALKDIDFIQVQDKQVTLWDHAANGVSSAYNGVADGLAPVGDAIGNGLNAAGEVIGEAVLPDETIHQLNEGNITGGINVTDDFDPQKLKEALKLDPLGEHKLAMVKEAYPHLFPAEEVVGEVIETPDLPFPTAMEGLTPQQQAFYILQEAQANGVAGLEHVEPKDLTGFTKLGEHGGKEVFVNWSEADPKDIQQLTGSDFFSQHPDGAEYLTSMDALFNQASPRFGLGAAYGGTAGAATAGTVGFAQKIQEQRQNGQMAEMIAGKKAQLQGWKDRVLGMGASQPGMDSNSRV